MPRKHERLPLSLEVVMESSSGKREARISDLSMSGCFVDSIVIALEGETVAFKLCMPTGNWLRLAGEVVYCLPNIGFGIRFTNLTEEKQNLLELIIRANGGQP